jgi:3-oxoacyl-[acyl-carrier protein] reductase
MSREDGSDEVGYRAVIEVNLNAVVDLTCRLKDRLAAARGAVVNIGSTAGFIAMRDRPAYAASKAGLLGFTRSIADVCAKDGIRANLVAPGFVETRIIDWAKRMRPSTERSSRAFPPDGSVGPRRSRPRSFSWLRPKPNMCAVRA